MPHGMAEIRRRERQHQTISEMIDRPGFDFVRQTRQHLNQAMNLTNETNDEVQHDEQEMEDNEPE
jgi:hypothetical protein